MATRKTAKRKTYRKATRKTARRSAPRRKIGAISSSKPRKRVSGMASNKMISRLTDAAMVGVGVIGANYLSAKLAGTIESPYLRNGALVVGGLLLGGMMPALGGLGAGLAGGAVANVGSQLLLGGGTTGVRGVGALTAAERKMIETAARGAAEDYETTTGTAQGEVLTGLYDSADETY